MKKLSIVLFFALCLFVVSHAQEYEWTQWYKYNSCFSRGENTIVDSQGNVYTAGYFSSYSGMPYQFTAFVNKYDSHGTLLWSKFFPKGRTFIALDNADSLTVLAADSLASYSIIRCDEAGNNVLIKNLWTVNNREGIITQIVYDKQNNLHLLGYFESKFVYGQFNFQGPPQQELPLLGKFDKNFNCLWMRAGTSGFVEQRSLQIDKNGDIYWAGYIKTNVPLNYDNNSIAGDKFTGFVCRCDNNGNVIWLKKLAESSYGPVVKGIALDTLSNVYVCGEYFGGFTMGNTNLPGDLAANVFLAKLDQSGNHLWAKSLHGPGDDVSGGVTVSPDQLVHVALTFSGSVSVSQTLVTSSSTAIADFVDTNTPLLASYSSSGELLHLLKTDCGNSGAAECLAVNSDGQGNIYTTGFFSGQVNWGSTISSGTDSYYINKITYTNSLLRTKITELEFSYQIYPNPVAEMLTIEVNRQSSAPIRINIYSTTGSLLYNIEIKDQMRFKKVIDTRNFKANEVILEIISNGNKISKKIILE